MNAQPTKRNGVQSEYTAYKNTMEFRVNALCSPKSVDVV